MCELLQPGVIFDSVGLKNHYGDVTQQPASTVKPGETAVAVFRSANPRNDLRTDGTYLTVERLSAAGNWTVVCTDSCWETRFEWSRPGNSVVSSVSFARISWEVPMDALGGTYRIRHFNAHKEIIGTITQFSGTSNSFTVAP
jgi:neutral ceramidase